MVSGDLSTDLGWGILSSLAAADDEASPRSQEEINVRRRARQEAENAEDSPTALDAGDPGHQIDRLA